MNIEEAIDILKNSIADYVIGEYCEKCADNKICDDRNEDCYYQQAIDIVVTAYEKEKEKNKRYEKYLKSKDKQHEQVLEYLETEKENEYISKEKIKERIKEYYEYDKRMQNKPDWHTTKYYEAKALEKLLEE